MAGNREVFNVAMSDADSRRWEGQWTEAAKAYQAALAEFPDDLVARGGLGFCYMQTKQWAQALTQYEYVLNRDPSNVIALSKTAEIYAIQGRRQEAFGAYIRLGELYLQQGQGARAEAAWQKAANLAPDSPDPHERLAHHYRGRKDLAAAVSEYLAAAQAYAAQKDHGRARMYCEEVLRADPHNAQAQSLLASLAADEHAARHGQEAQPAALGRAEPAMPAVSAAGLGTVASPEASRWSPEPSATRSRPEVQEATQATASIDGPGSMDAGTNGTTGIVESNMGNASTTNSYSDGTGMPPGGGRGPTVGPGVAAPRGRLTAAQVSGVLRQAQQLQAQGRLREAIGLCEQIFESGFDRPDARYFLGWLYQEAQQWDAAIAHFSRLLNDPDYALSCYYALGQCYARKGDLQTAAQYFDEAVDRVNLDALTIDEVEQLIQLCQEAAETHRAIGEIDQGYNVLNALLGFLQSRGWLDRAAQVEQLIRYYQRAAPPVAGATIAFPASPTAAPPAAPESATMAFPVPPAAGAPAASPPVAGEAAATMAFSGASPMPPTAATPAAAQPTVALPTPPAAPAASAAPSPAEGATIAFPTPGTAPAEPDFLDWLNSGPTPAAPAAADQPASAAPGAATYTPEQPAAPPPSATSPVPGTQPEASRPAELPTPPTSGLQTLEMMPEPLRGQVVQAMADIDNYVAHGLLMAATEECMRVIELAPNYLEVHRKLCEIYERQGKTEQAITKYAILIDIYRANGRPDEAIALYHDILRLEPQNFSYRSQLINLLAAMGRRDEEQRERVAQATMYLQLGYIDRAIHEFEQIIAVNPTNVAVRMNLAVALTKAGRLSEALAAYQRILQLDPGNMVALARWQIALTGGENTTAAIEALSRVIHFLRGDGQRQLELIEREYVVAMDATPGNMLLRYSFGQIKQHTGNYDEAIQLYRQALREPDLEVLTRFAMAQCYLAQGSATAAQAAAQQLEQAAVAVRHVPVDPAVWTARPRDDTEEHQAPEVEIALLLAQAYRQTGQIEQMQALLQQVKRALPYRDELHGAAGEAPAQSDNLTATLREYADLAHRYRATQQIDKAIITLQEMTRLAPDAVAPRAELGDIYISWGLLEEGLAELRTVATIYLRRGHNDEAAQVLQRIAAIYWDMGNREEALDTYRRVIELIPQDMQARMDMVRCCLQCGLRREAAEHQSVVAHHYFATQQTKDAVASLQQLIAMDRSNYEAYDLLGQTYTMAGEYEQASRVYRNLMKVDPDNAVARQRLTELLELRSRSE